MAGYPAVSRERIGKAVTLIRQQQRLSVVAAAAVAPMSATTWQRVEDGKPVRGLTLRGIEGVLSLRPGLLSDLMSGSADWAEIEALLVPQEAAAQDADAGLGKSVAFLREWLTWFDALPSEEQAREIRKIRGTPEPPDEDEAPGRRAG